jgi:short subunit fatty acids transporter
MVAKLLMLALNCLQYLFLFMNILLYGTFPGTYVEKIQFPSTAEAYC